MRLGVGGYRTLAGLRAVFVAYTTTYGYSESKTPQEDKFFWDKKARIYIGTTLLRLLELNSPIDILEVRGDTFDPVFDDKEFAKGLQEAAGLSDPQAEVAEVAVAESMTSHVLEIPFTISFGEKRLTLVLAEAEMDERRRKRGGPSNTWISDIEDIL